jgi:hypothetical protein
MILVCPPRQPCTRSQIEHVRKFVAYAKLRVNEAWIYPPVNAYRYMVALVLHSECITVAEASDLHLRLPPLAATQANNFSCLSM